METKASLYDFRSKKLLSTKAEARSMVIIYCDQEQRMPGHQKLQWQNKNAFVGKDVDTI